MVSKDNWPPDAEKGLFARLCQEAIFTETTLLWILWMGLSKEHPILPTETIDLAEHLIFRSQKSLVTLEKLEIIDLLFRLTEYKHPENICLPLK